MNVGPCRICECSMFWPQYWKDHKCKECFHAIVEHTPETKEQPFRSVSSILPAPCHRDRVAFEILSSEKTYVENMQVFINVFMLPLQERDVISTSAINSIFSNIEAIVKVNKELLSTLEKRMDSWGPTQRIGDVMLTFTPFLKMYTKYTTGYDAALSTLGECEKSSAFTTFLVKCQENPQTKSLNLRSFLIQPVQRIPRYNMLLEDLLKHTDQEHVDHKDLCSALAKMKVVANDINEAIRISENRAKVLSVQMSFIQDVTLIAPHRMYVKESILTKICRKSHKRYTFFLFTDCVLYGAKLPSGRYVFHRMIPLDSCRLEDTPDSDTAKFAFQIYSSQKSFAVFAETMEEKVEWLLDLTEMINKLREKRMTFRRHESTIIKKEDEEFPAEAPTWVPDHAVKQCSLCNNGFSVIRRRHHCRACGGVVCAHCSPKQILLPTIDPKNKVRVCLPCHDRLNQDQLMQQSLQEVPVN